MQNLLDRPLADFLKKVKAIHLVIALIILFAVISRFYLLGERVMSHDEVNHVVPAFDLYSGRGYRHDPITHGPLQFHLMAFSYFLFGDNDFTSRLPHAVFSIATVAFILIFYRRFLGKFGSLAAGVLFVISPFMLFYGRYARNEAICAFLAVVALYAILRYYEEGRNSMLLLLTTSLSLNFAAKETAYIFTAQLLIFVLILTLMDLIRLRWENGREKFQFLVSNALAIIIVIAAIGLSAFLAGRIYVGVQQSAAPTIPSGGGIISFVSQNFPFLLSSLPIILPLAASLIALVFLKPYLGWNILNPSRSFNILILVGTLVLPLLAPFPVTLAGIDPTAYGESFVVFVNTVYIAYLFGLSAIIGSYWDYQFWWKCALVFFGIFVVLYTTFFTNTAGFITGLVGSLGHWLAQHEVQRGGQPSYYYAIILIPIYEFVGALATLTAFYFGIRHRSFWTELPHHEDTCEEKQGFSNILPLPSLFLYWTITSLIAYSIAGEKMPWLTVHIAFSMLLTAGWVVEKMIRNYLAEPSHQERGLLRFFLLTLAVLLGLMVILQLWGNRAPFQGNTQQQLRDTNFFIFLIFCFGAAVYIIYRSRLLTGFKQVINAVGLVIFGLLSLVTARTAYQSSFINYDYPLEFLVYAHAADGPRHVLQQVEDVSRRTTGGLDIKVAYDNHALYPYWWYMRNYPNKIVYLENPTRALEEAPMIIAGSDKYAKIDTIVRDNYYAQEYFRLWWPMQDYWNLTWERISDAFSNADMRQALFNIWLNRDYSLYAQITNNQFLKLENWLPSEKMRLYIRKDIAAQMWQYQTEASLGQIIQADPYLDKLESRRADYFIGKSGSLSGELNAPRGMEIASDGSIIIADSRNHRVQQFSQNGDLIRSFGTFASILEGEAPGGTFNEPWDVAIGPDGSIYVADTFNHRIQKFSATGRFIKTWGIFAQGDGPDTFWGPRGIAVAPNGNVLITDTGNKRVVVFDRDLNFITQFGGGGFDPGQFDEPVGIDIAADGRVAVADTWNRRVQVFQPSADGTVYVQVSSFDVAAWYGQSMDNKPYLTFTPAGNILVTDPEGGRLLEFTISGEYVRGWQDLSPSPGDITLPFGVDFDTIGNLWVADGSMNLLMRLNPD